jgi:hypothetical protein
MTDSLWDEGRPEWGAGAVPEPPSTTTGDCVGRGFLEILLYTTPAGRLVLDLDGSGVPHLQRSFRSGAELGEFVSDLLAGGVLIGHPVLVALRDAAERLPPG